MSHYSRLLNGEPIEAEKKDAKKPEPKTEKKGKKK